MVHVVQMLSGQSKLMLLIDHNDDHFIAKTKSGDDITLIKIEKSAPVWRAGLETPYEYVLQNEGYIMFFDSPPENTNEIAVFDYMAERFGYRRRLDQWTEEVCTHFQTTSREARARAGFVPDMTRNQKRLRCEFCHVTIHEPLADSQLMYNHINASPDCTLVQSEINYHPHRPEFISVEVRVVILRIQAYPRKSKKK